MELDAIAHRVENDKLILTTGRSSEEAFLEPREWWRQETPGYVNYLHSGASLSERSAWYLFNAHVQASRCYTLRSRHANRKAVVHADSKEQDGSTLRLLLQGEVVALFDDPAPIHVERRRYTSAER